MGWVLFVLYFVSMGFIGTSYRFYILDERHTNPNIVKKRERLKDIEEQFLSELYVRTGIDKKELRVQFDNYIGDLVFLLSWLTPVLILYKLIGRFFKHG